MLSSLPKQGPTVAIVGAAETPVGQHIARVLARGDFQPLVGEIRGLVEQSQQKTLRPVLAFLATQGMRPVNVNYNEVASIESALKDAPWMVMVPPMLQAAPQSCVQEAQRVVQAAKKAGVQNVILLSYAACDTQPELKWLAAFREIERVVVETFPQQSVVLRLGFPAQALRLAAQQVREAKTMELPIDPAQPFNPVDLDDVARVVANIVNGTTAMDKTFRGQTLPVFGPAPVTGRVIAQMITEVVQPIHGKPVQWRDQVSRDELAQRFSAGQRRFLDTLASLPAPEMIRCGGAPAPGKEHPIGACANTLGPFNVNIGFAGVFLDLCQLAGEGKLAGNTSAVVTKLHGGQPWFPVERAIREAAPEWI